MHINLILIPLVIILGLLFGFNDNPKNRRLYIYLCSAVLLFVAAMRSPEFFFYKYRLDTLNYQDSFEMSFDMGWSEFWSAAVGRYVGHNDDYDIGFIGLMKIIGFFTHDFHIYSLLADLLFFIPFGIILYRYCTSMRQLIFAFVFYISLVQVYFLGGARQIFAMGFDLMAFLAVVDRKRNMALFFFLLGVSIHFSSILFALPLLMIWLDAKPKILKVLHIICFVLFPLVLIMPNEITYIMGIVSGLDKYTAYSESGIQGGAVTFIILIEVLSLFCLLAIKKQDLINGANIRFFYTMAPFFTLFAPLIYANGSLTRITLYYYLFLALLVPSAIDCAFKKDIRNIVYVVAIGSLAFLTISSGGIEYQFYWQ